MSNVFLSYAREDRHFARRIVAGLRALGIDVIWDDDLLGVDWQSDIEKKITESSAVIAFWTPQSFNSDAVRDEARLARSQNKLVNVLNGVKEPRHPFDAINGIPLDDWKDGEPHHDWTRLVQSVERALSKFTGRNDYDFHEKQKSYDNVIGKKEDIISRELKNLTARQLNEQRALSVVQNARGHVRTATAELVKANESGLSGVVLNAARSAAQEQLDSAERELRQAEGSLQDAKDKVENAQHSILAAQIVLKQTKDDWVEGLTLTGQVKIFPPQDVMLPEISQPEDLRHSIQPILASKWSKYATKKWIYAAIVLLCIVPVSYWFVHPYHGDSPPPPLPPPNIKTISPENLKNSQTLAQSMKGWWIIKKYKGNCRADDATALHIDFDGANIELFRWNPEDSSKFPVYGLVNGWLIDANPRILREYKLQGVELLSRASVNRGFRPTELRRCNEEQSRTLDDDRHDGVTPKQRSDALKAADNLKIAQSSLATMINTMPLSIRDSVRRNQSEMPLQDQEFCAKSVNNAPNQIIYNMLIQQCKTDRISQNMKKLTDFANSKESISPPVNPQNPSIVN